VPRFDTKEAHMARKRRDPYLEAAEAQSIVRFGPEMSALRALLSAATQSYEDRVRQAKSAREFTVGSVNAAVPQVRQAYRGAEAAVSPAFAAQGGVEAGALHARLGEAQALARAQLAGRRVSAVEGEGAARAQALREVGRERQQIGGRGVDLAREIGAFTTATAGDMRSADAAAQAEIDRFNAGLTQQERNSIRSSGFDPDSGLPLPGGKADPNRNKGKGAAWASIEQQGAAVDDFDTLRGFAEKLKRAGIGRADAAQSLQVGQDAQEVPIYREVKLPNGSTKQEKVLWRKGEKGNEDGSLTGTPKTRKVPAVPQAKSKLLLVAALDQVYDGHLSRRTQKLLHERRLKIAPLGATTFQQWLKTAEGRAWQAEQRRRRSGSGGSGTPGISPINGR
jgi:hypothetical protein